MFPLNPRDLQRLMKKMGLKMEPVDASYVEVRLSGGERLVFTSPQVILVTAKGQPPMMYVIGEFEREPAEEASGGLEISEEDVMLVAEQAGVPPETARKALEESGGDIAEAILRWKGESA